MPFCKWVENDNDNRFPVCNFYTCSGSERRDALRGGFQLMFMKINVHKKDVKDILKAMFVKAGLSEE